MRPPHRSRASTMWPELPVARKRAVLAALIKRIDVKVDQIDIHLRPLRLCALLNLPATPSQGVNDDEIELLSVPVRLRRSGQEIRMVINGTDSFAAKPDARLIKLLLRARRFNATLAQSEGLNSDLPPCYRGHASADAKI
jgi:hypothetical protein